jgi:hypothetical protein
MAPSLVHCDTVIKEELYKRGKVCGIEVCIFPPPRESLGIVSKTCHMDQNPPKLTPHTPAKAREVALSLSHIPGYHTVFSAPVPGIKGFSRLI